VITITTDIILTSLSAASALAEVVLIAVDGPMPIGDAVAAIGYYAVINPIENIVSTIGFGSTALSDVVRGNTYIDASNGDIVIGQDTLVSGTGMILGNIPVEAIGDTVINVPTLIYDIRGFTDNPVTFGGHRWELRYNWQEREAYFMGYPSAN